MFVSAILHQILKQKYSIFYKQQLIYSKQYKTIQTSFHAANLLNKQCIQNYKTSYIMDITTFYGEISRVSEWVIVWVSDTNVCLKSVVRIALALLSNYKISVVVDSEWVSKWASDTSHCTEIVVMIVYCSSF